MGSAKPSRRSPEFLGLSLSEAQETLLRSIYGLPLSEAQLRLWQLCTGRETYSPNGFREVTVIAGARSGKDSRIAAPIICYEALFGGQRELHRGERAIMPLVAQNFDATKIAFGYIRSFLRDSPLLASQVADEKATQVELKNRVVNTCFPCTQKGLRGWSIPVGVSSPSIASKARPPPMPRDSDLDSPWNARVPRDSTRENLHAVRKGRCHLRRLPEAFSHRLPRCARVESSEQPHEPR
jgi:hypothetical protein